MVYRFIMEGRPLRLPEATPLGPERAVETRSVAAVTEAVAAAINAIDLALIAQCRRADDRRKRETRASHRPPPGTPVEHRTSGRILGVH